MEYIRLDKLVDLKQGLAINSHSNHLVSKDETELPLLRIADMPTKSRVVFMKPETPERFIAHEEDIIYTRTGQVGLVFKEQYGVVHNNCFRVYPIDEAKLSREYLYWSLKLPSTYKWANSIAAGAAQPDLPHSSFKKIKIPMFPIKEQQKIASILSCYDNLIQNYKKQIEALQTTASELYKECFVRLRFPGWQTAKFENGIPVGWKVERLTEIIEVKYGKDHSKIEDGIIPILGSGGIMRYGNKFLYDKESVLIPRKGSLNNIMYMNEPFWTVDTMFYSIMKRKNVAKYIYYVLSKIDMELFNSGAALPSMTTDILSHFKILVPNDEILASFDKKIDQIFKRTKILEQQITNLTQQRDLLLPRLMRGALKVH